MLDLFLTDSGDLSFLTNTFTKSSEGFSFNFHIASSESLLFNFYVENNMDEEFDKTPITDREYVSDRFKFNFYTYTPEYNKIVKTVSNKGYIQQCIKLRLSTELSTIRGNTDMGSNLHTIMHSSIPDNKLQTQIERMIKESIGDILPDASVSVSFLNTDYLNYHDGIKIVIINNEDVYYYIV